MGAVSIDRPAGAMPAYLAMPTGCPSRALPRQQLRAGSRVLGAELAVDRRR